MFYVYILQGESGKHYIGYTSDIQQRLSQHQAGQTPTTSKMGKIKLIGYFIKETKTDAIKLERMIKRNGHIEHRINHSSFVKH